MHTTHRAFAALLVAALTYNTSLIAQTGTIDCQSDGSYKYCRADTANQVRLARQISQTRCQQNYNWGYDWRGIWVDRGCCAKFDYGVSKPTSNTEKAVTAGILGAIIVGAVVASSNSDQHDSMAPRRDYYRDGYRMGQRDWDSGKQPYYLAYRNRFPREAEGIFARGYDDGYNNRHGTRDRYDEDIFSNISDSMGFPKSNPPARPGKGPRPGSRDYGTINNPNHGAAFPQPGEADYGTINNPNHGAGAFDSGSPDYGTINNPNKGAGNPEPGDDVTKPQ